MRVLVLGAAISGRAAARLAIANGHDVLIYDRRAAAVVDAGGDVDVIAGEWRMEILNRVDYVVTSPGFPEHVGPIPDILRAGLPLVSEMEYAVSHMDVRYAAVTGTNGKTTVAAATADMLVNSGIDAIAAGNIGTALSDVALDPRPVVVIEASSFQLRFIDRFHPEAAALLNIAPDHLDWHQDLDEYVAAKQRIFENQTESNILVFDADDPGAAAAVTTATARLIPVSGRRRPESGYGPEDDRLALPSGSMPRPDLDIAYTMDLAAAAVLADQLGATMSGIEQTISSFAPGEHRRTEIGNWDDVTWVNDSKATNPHAAAASVAAFSSVVLIAGGRNKGLDLSPIVAAPNVRLVIGLGEAASELAEVTDAARYVVAADLEHAVTIADERAIAGDTVLLAPGCASFDMFDSYAARGDAFVSLVTELKGASDGN